MVSFFKDHLIFFSMFMHVSIEFYLYSLLFRSASISSKVISSMYQFHLVAI